MNNTILRLSTIFMANLLLTPMVFAQGVGINTAGATPDPSAILDASSTTQGFLPPRMTTAQRNAMSAPAEGLMIYNTDLKCIQFNKGTSAIPNWSCTDGTNQSNPCGTSTVTFIYNGAPVTYGTVVGANYRCWLDRNLGASQVATSSTDHLSYGDFFQWGRGDDGHQRINWTSATSGTPVNVSSGATSNSITPGNADFLGQGVNNWYTGMSPHPDSLWQGVNGINNPCPAGWRIPTLAELIAEKDSWSSDDPAGAFASPLKLPMAGMRAWNQPNTLWNVGDHGFYWSSTISNNPQGGVSRYIYFDWWNSATQISQTQRTNGVNVRCIKD